MPRFGLDDESESEEERDERMDVTPEKFQDVDAWQDEDAAVVSDAEDPYADAMVQEAYAKLRGAVEGYKPTDMELSSEDPYASDDDDNFDEGYESSGEEEPVSTSFTTAEDFVECSKLHSGTGICNQVSKKVFENERRGPPKNLEYGLRMGRSFHVGWSPDGSFLKLCPGGTKLQRFRPVFDDAKGLGRESTKYLDHHKANSQKLAPTTRDDLSPRFMLPLSIANGGDSASHEALHQTLTSFASEGKETCDLAFALLACLIDDEHSVSSGFDPTTKDAQFNARRKEALTRFFVDACKATTIADIREQNDVHAEVYAALTGGDLRKACEIAVSKGHENLAACISTFDVAGNADLKEQARRAASGKIPENLRRIYQLLSGDIHCSKDLGWIRCFLMRLMYDAPQRTDSDLVHALNGFRGDVKGAKAPFPSPQYSRGGNQDGTECILFRLLRLAESPQSISCSEIVDPRGFTFFKHDFKLPFIMASALSSAGVCGPLSTWQEERIIDGYVSQLISAGQWEWAVYVSLTSLNPDMLDAQTDWKRKKAKEIVLRHYKEGGSLSFLGDISVPKEWISEALADRYVSKGDPFVYIEQLASFSVPRMAGVLDEIVLPNIPFLGAREKEACLTFLRSAEGELSALSAAYLNMLEIEKELFLQLEEQQVQAMHETLQEIEVTFQAERAKLAKLKGAPLKFQAAYNVVPLASMLSEAIQHVQSLKMKLKCLEMGIEVDSNSSQRKLKALLAFHA